MCQCNPNVRTPFCGIGDCVWPEQVKQKPDPIPRIADANGQSIELGNVRITFSSMVNHTDGSHTIAPKKLCARVFKFLDNRSRLSKICPVHDTALEIRINPWHTGWCNVCKGWWGLDESDIEESRKITQLVLGG